MLSGGEEGEIRPKRNQSTAEVACQREKARRVPGERRQAIGLGYILPDVFTARQGWHRMVCVCVRSALEDLHSCPRLGRSISGRPYPRFATVC